MTSWYWKSLRAWIRFAVKNPVRWTRMWFPSSIKSIEMESIEGDDLTSYEEYFESIDIAGWGCIPSDSIISQWKQWKKENA